MYSCKKNKHFLIYRLIYESINLKLFIFTCRVFFVSENVDRATYPWALELRKDVCGGMIGDLNDNKLTFLKNVEKE